MANKEEKNDTEKTEPEEKTELSGFNLSEFKASGIDPTAQSKKLITTIPVGKPKKQNFFRVHPSLEYPVYIRDWEDDGTSYLVHPRIAPKITNQVKLKIVYVSVYATGSPFLLAVPQPDMEGKWNNWHQSLSEAVDVAKKKWIRLEPDKIAQGYNIIYAAGSFGEPEWPNMTIDQYIETAFKSRQIIDENHPKIKELKGIA